MVTNPFENADGTYLVLLNEEGQYSLWPSFVEVPAGWEVVVPETDRQICLDYINENWTDMRPKSLIRAMEAEASIHPDETQGESVTFVQYDSPDGSHISLHGAEVTSPGGWNEA
jgi:MbtH protein